MINNYTRPQLFIRQVLDILDDAGPKRLNAFIFGPQYNLKRYTNPSERETLQGAAFTTSQQSLPYEGREGGTIVDKSFVRVFGENLLVTLGTLDDTSAPTLGVGRNTLHAATGSAFAGTNLATELSGRSVSVGDIVLVTIGGADFSRTVLSVDGFDKITLNGAIPGSEDPEKVVFQLRYSGELSASTFTAKDDEVTVNANASVIIHGRTSPSVTPQNGEGKLYVSYRAFVPAANTESYVVIRNRQDITDNFGKIDPDNTLAYGAYVALTGAQGERIYAARITSNDIDGYSAVLRKAENSDVLYALCPLTYDADIQNAVKDHVEAMSSDSRKQWRRAYLSTKNPGEYPAIRSSVDPSVAKAISGSVAALGSFHVITATGEDFILNGIKAGDIVRSGGNDYIVRNVLSSTELEVSGGPTGSSITFTLIKPSTGGSQADYVAARSKELNSRRAVNVWVDSPMATINGVLTEQEVYYVAAEIAGLRSALLPQQGLSRTEVATIHSAPLMYTMYTQDELDIAAAAGTFIITQDVENGPVYIRHQLTTRTSEGSLYYEDSAGTNVDNISYLIKDQYEPLIGVENATPDTIGKLRTRIQDILIDQSRGDSGLGVGPAIVGIPEGYPQVFLDPIMRDTIRVAAKVELPLPLNTIIVDLHATVSVGG